MKMNIDQQEGLGGVQGPPPVRRLLNEKEAAAYLGVSVAWLRQSRMKHPPAKSTVGPPFHRFGKLIRYSIEDLDAWQAEHRVDPRLPRDLINGDAGRAGGGVPNANATSKTEAPA